MGDLEKSFYGTTTGGLYPGISYYGPDAVSVENIDIGELTTSIEAMAEAIASGTSPTVVMDALYFRASEVEMDQASLMLQRMMAQAIGSGGEYKHGAHDLAKRKELIEAMRKEKKFAKKTDEEILDFLRKWAAEFLTEGEVRSDKAYDIVSLLWDDQKKAIPEDKIDVKPIKAVGIEGVLSFGLDLSAVKDFITNWRRRQLLTMKDIAELNKIIHAKYAVAEAVTVINDILTDEFQENVGEVSENFAVLDIVVSKFLTSKAELEFLLETLSNDENIRKQREGLAAALLVRRAPVSQIADLISEGDKLIDDSRSQITQVIESFDSVLGRISLEVASGNLFSVNISMEVKGIIPLVNGELKLIIDENTTFLQKAYGSIGGAPSVAGYVAASGTYYHGLLWRMIILNAQTARWMISDIDELMYVLDKALTSAERLEKTRGLKEKSYEALQSQIGTMSSAELYSVEAAKIKNGISFIFSVGDDFGRVLKQRIKAINVLDDPDRAVNRIITAIGQEIYGREGLSNKVADFLFERVSQNLGVA